MIHTQESAELVAIQALGWLAANDDLMPVFLNASGADVADLRKQARDPAFLAAVLDFLLMDDAWVVGFCEHAQLKYDAPMRARAALPGGEQVNWT
jgi:hypothetical protein